MRRQVREMEEMKTWRRDPADCQLSQLVTDRIYLLLSCQVSICAWFPELPRSVSGRLCALSSSLARVHISDPGPGISFFYIPSLKSLSVMSFAPLIFFIPTAPLFMLISVCVSACVPVCRCIYQDESKGKTIF